MDQSLPKTERIRKRADFIRIQKSGYKIAASHILALLVTSNLTWTRLGLTVSKQVGNAVVRNRVKRLLREAFRRQKSHLPPGVDLVIIARSSAAQASFLQLNRDLEETCRRAARVRL